MSPSKPRSAEERIEAIPSDRLSPRGLEAKKIAERVVEGFTHEEVAQEFGIAPREVGQAMRELEVEWRGLVDGATLPPLSQPESEALMTSLGLLGQLVPILVDENGEVLDGNHRKAAAEALGLEVETRTIVIGDDPARRRDVMLAANTVRRTLSASARREAVEAEILRDPERSDRSIAATLGVANHTVAAARSDLEERGQVLRLEHRVDKRGTSQPARKPSRTRRPTGEHREPAAPAPSMLLEIDVGDTAGGRLGFVAGEWRLYVPERAWNDLGQPLAFQMTIEAVGTVE